MEEKKTVEEEPKASLFPLFSIADSNPSKAITSSSSSSSPLPHWLCNSSFTTDLGVINDAVSSQLNSQPEKEEENDREQEEEEGRSDVQTLPEASSRVYEQLESSESEGDLERNNKKKKSKKKRKRQRSSERVGEFGGDFRSRRSDSRVWSSSGTKSSKDYYFDSHGDPDNLVFGCLYKMDVPRYKAYTPPELSGPRNDWFTRSLGFDRDGDIDSLDSKLKSGGRYWSSKYVALESHKELKRAHIVATGKVSESVEDDFLPLLDGQTTSVVEEESWEDEVLRKTREFNKLTRERPHDEKVWLDFAKFQDKVASMQPQKGARLQTLEKKISILEKAAELNPDNEELLICLLKAYQSRDSIDVLIGRWEKILVHNSGSYKLWREFLCVIQGEFSMFKVSKMRKMYANAIQALSTACSQHFRQANREGKASSDSSIVQLELGLVDIFLNLCRFEWQAGYQELATALFQAEIEYSLFSPPLFLNEQSKHRLFEHFWNSNGARLGEEGALGWSTWLEKEEESRQKVIKEETSSDAEGGWTGWSEPFARTKESARNPENETNNNMEVEEVQEESENEDMKQEDDTEALLKELGIDVDAGSNFEVKDTSTWSKWSEEELSRDTNQWMPVRAKSGVGASHSDGTLGTDADEQILRVIMYEDVNEYLFSLSSYEARLSLLSQFIDFFGGKIPQWMSSNSSSWIEKILSLEELPDSMLKNLRRVHDVLGKSKSGPQSSSLEFLLGSTNDVSRRTDMMKFLRNAILLCLTAFPHNYILEEAALVAEELSVTKMNSCSCSVTPCRALAKSLLKNDRQDVLLCGVYAQREAFYGNLDYARRVFDMALLSIEGLPMELQSKVPLLYFWYAEVELANSSGNSSESSSRAMHILSCLGSGVAYGPFKSKPSSVQLLRAHQGFKERMRTVRSAWVRGVVDDQSVALICSAALFEESTTGWTAGIEVLDQALAMVLPERRSHSHQIEFLFNFYVKMLHRHHDLSKCWEYISQGLQIFPFSLELSSSLVEIGHLFTTSNKLRLMFDDHCHKKQSVVVWLYALTYEISRGGSQHRIHGLFERALTSDRTRNSVLLWRCYIAYEVNIVCNLSAARRIFFRAIHACPWSKKLWLDGFFKLNPILSAKELSDFQEVMRDKELNLRTDIYEILLQDELVL